MRRSAAVREEKVLLAPPTRISVFETDARWHLSQRVVASRHFSKSPLLSKFLLYIVAETLEDRSDEITEHQIGVRVFDRPSTYRTVEDNIVRNYARQLRRRLCEYFADEGAADPLRIDIPLGGYIPVFVAARTWRGSRSDWETRSRSASGQNCRTRTSLSAFSRGCDVSVTGRWYWRFC